ncbi:hypothetical protein LWM68_15720 [Niabella sp. W65]|nr:hypothetical protein [Niabella sp. W65]MCH7364075.1 hypothetical protein [Niabella sp. W65]ULT39955.1 hypothetical protein KRR40_34540 [Niabella sp. I65]
MVEIANDVVQLVSFSGSTANALAGRFTLADEAIHAHCVGIAEQEQNANPSVLFLILPICRRTK